MRSSLHELSSSLFITLKAPRYSKLSESQWRDNCPQQLALLFHRQILITSWFIKSRVQLLTHETKRIAPVRLGRHITRWNKFLVIRLRAFHTSIRHFCFLGLSEYTGSRPSSNLDLRPQSGNLRSRATVDSGNDSAAAGLSRCIRNAYVWAIEARKTEPGHGSHATDSDHFGTSWLTLQARL